MGGPDATSSPHLYDKADHLILGEAEITMPEFLAEFHPGKGQAHLRGRRPQGGHGNQPATPF